MIAFIETEVTDSHGNMRSATIGYEYVAMQHREVEERLVQDVWVMKSTDDIEMYYGKDKALLREVLEENGEYGITLNFDQL